MLIVLANQVRPLRPSMWRVSILDMILADSIPVSLFVAHFLTHVAQKTLQQSEVYKIKEERKSTLDGDRSSALKVSSKAPRSTPGRESETLHWVFKTTLSGSNHERFWKDDKFRTHSLAGMCSFPLSSDLSRFWRVCDVPSDPTGASVVCAWHCWNKWPAHRIPPECSAYPTAIATITVVGSLIRPTGPPGFEFNDSRSSFSRRFSSWSSWETRSGFDYCQSKIIALTNTVPE